MLRPVRIRHYLSVMEARGVPAARVLEGSGIDASRLNDPQYLIDAAACRHVIGNLLRLSGDPGIGFEVGRAAEPSDLGIIGYAVMSCRSMRQTLSLWRQYSNSLVGIMSRLALAEDDDENLTVTVVEPAQLDPIFIFCAEEILVMMVKIGGMLAGGEPVVKRLEFSYRAPPHSHRYHEAFHCPIQFGAPRTAATVAREWLDRRLRTNDEEFNAICLKHCSQILQQIEHTGPVVSRLRGLFLRNPAAVPRLDDAAAELGLSPRSLRRHLLDEGASYQKLVDEFRADLAREYLRSTRLSTKEIAFLLGYADQSAFRRAFKLWTGRTTREYRETALGPSSSDPDAVA